MGLHEKPFGIALGFDDGGQFSRVRSRNPGTQDHKVCVGFKLLTQDMVPEGDGHLAAFSFFHHRRLIFVKPEKNHPHVPGLCVEFFHHAVHSHVTIEDKHIGFRHFFLDGNGIFHGILAADPGTIGILLASGSHTLNHDHLIQRLGFSLSKGICFNHVGKFQLGDNTIAFIV